MRSTPEYTFGDLLRRLRSEAALTQEQLSEQAGLSTRAISDLERGINRYPYRSTVQSLTQALDCPRTMPRSWRNVRGEGGA